MFEDSFISDAVAERRSVLRLALLSALVLQTSIAATLALLPLLRPARLSADAANLPMALPMVVRRRPEPPPRPSVIEQVVVKDAFLAPMESTRSRVIERAVPTGMPAPAAISAFRLGTSGPPVWIVAGAGAGRGVRVANGGPETEARAPAGQHAVRVSSGVSAGLLLAPIRPVYPKIAVAVRVDGTVVVEAVISRTGEVVQAHVRSGPAMLGQAALDAIRAARYRPFRLNDQPTEVETTFSVVFRLGPG